MLRQFLGSELCQLLVCKAQHPKQDWLINQCHVCGEDIFRLGWFYFASFVLCPTNLVIWPEHPSIKRPRPAMVPCKAGDRDPTLRARQLGTSYSLSLSPQNLGLTPYQPTSPQQTAKYSLLFLNTSQPAANCPCTFILSCVVAAMSHLLLRNLTGLLSSPFLSGCALRKTLFQDQFRRYETSMDFGIRETRVQI